jgi:hypothetical protein
VAPSPITSMDHVMFLLRILKVYQMENGKVFYINGALKPYFWDHGRLFRDKLRHLVPGYPGVHHILWDYGATHRHDHSKLNE